MPRPFAALPETVEHGLDHLVQAEPALGVQLGRESHLGVHDPVGGQVLGAFGGHPVQRLGGLHDPDRVPEGVQVDLQVTAVRALGEPLGQLFFVIGGQAVVARLAGQLEDGPRAQAAVQVVVQQDLRHGPDLGKCRHLPILLRGTDSEMTGETAGGGPWSLTATAPSSAARAGPKRSGSSARSSSSGWPACTSSPGLARQMMPAAALTSSSLRARPAPRRQAAMPTSARPGWSASRRRARPAPGVRRLGQRGVRVTALRADHRPVGGQRPAVGDGRGGIASCGCRQRDRPARASARPAPG